LARNRHYSAKFRFPCVIGKRSTPVGLAFRQCVPFAAVTRWSFFDGDAGFPALTASSTVGARAADVVIEDRRAVRSTLVRGMPVELVVKDGTDRSIAERADVDRACGGGVEPFTAEVRASRRMPAGPKALFGMGGPAF
jgi:hypothetical protein